MSRDALLTLAARCEALATSGRYEIDRDRRSQMNEAIAVAIGLPLTQRLGDPALGNARTVPTRIQDYVGSIDAAMTLVPDGLMAAVVRFSDGSGHANIHDGANVGDDGIFVRAASPAFALSAAALRARAGAA